MTKYSILINDKVKQSVHFCSTPKFILLLEAILIIKLTNASAEQVHKTAFVFI